MSKATRPLYLLVVVVVCLIGRPFDVLRIHIHARDLHRAREHAYLPPVPPLSLSSCLTIHYAFTSLLYTSLLYTATPALAERFSRYKP